MKGRQDLLLAAPHSAPAERASRQSVAPPPRGDLLRLKGIQARFAEPLPASVGKPAFAKWCTTRLRRLLPIHSWLVEHVASGSGRR